MANELGFGLQPFTALINQVAAATANLNGGATATATAAAGGANATQAAPGAQGAGQKDLMLDGVGKVLQGLGEILKGLSGSISEPSRTDCGGLTSDATAQSITTSGGYKITPAKDCFGWTVTGPDGKTSTIWGDPHVKEGDGGNWDFKKDATFVLGDGTKVHVKTKPWGDGSATVTDKLEIENNGQVAEMSGFDLEGNDQKVKVGQVRAGKADFATQETFVMGRETDDWAFQGKEIKGTQGGPDNFVLGDALDTTQNAATAAATAGAIDHGNQLAQGGGFAAILAQLQNTLAQLGAGGAPAQNTQAAQGNNGGPQPQQPQTADNLKQAFSAITAMFQLLASVLQLLQAARAPAGGQAK